MRLASWDYASNGKYFITFVSHQRRMLFGTIGLDSDHAASRVELNELGKATEEALLRVGSISPTIEIDKYVIMPNHVHLILSVHNLDKAARKDVSTFVASVKRRVSVYARKHDIKTKIWQKSFYDHIIRNEKDHDRIWEYIESNPAKWSEDKLMEDY